MKNKLGLTYFIVIFFSFTALSQSLPDKEIVKAFLKSKTYIVFDVGMFSSYNFYIKDVIEKEWTVTPFEFISYSEFDSKRKESKSSFLVLTDVVFTGDKSQTVYNFLNLVLGGNYQSIDNMPDIINFPLSVSGQDEDLYVYKLSSIIRFIQNHVLMLKQQPELCGKNIEEIYRIKKTGFDDKTFYFLKDELAPEINSVNNIKSFFPYSVKITGKEEIEKAITERAKNVIFLHKVGSSEKSGNKQCFVILLGADDSDIYFYSHHKISKREGDFLTKKELLKIAHVR